MIRAIVCPHVRWAGRPWVVISKTFGEPVNGLSTASLPAWFPRLTGGELQIRHIKIKPFLIQIAVDGESVRRSLKTAPHQFAANRPRRMCRNEQSLSERAGPWRDRTDLPNPSPSKRAGSSGRTD